MGVDYMLVRAYGYCIPTVGLDDVLASIKDRADLTVFRQDMYGDLRGDSQVLLALSTEVHVLAQFKVGQTPFSFLENQVYPVTNQLRAGARRFFAVGCKAPFDKTTWTMKNRPPYLPAYRPTFARCAKHRILTNGFIPFSVNWI